MTTFDAIMTTDAGHIISFGRPFLEHPAGARAICVSCQDMGIATVLVVVVEDGAVQALSFGTFAELEPTLVGYLPIFSSDPFSTACLDLPRQATIDPRLFDQLLESRRTALGEPVHRGARFLDGHYGDWWTRVDPARLDLSDGIDCVVGQLLGRNFFEGIAEVMAPLFPAGAPAIAAALNAAQAHGLLLPEGVQQFECGVLTEIWRDEILARRSRSLNTR